MTSFVKPKDSSLSEHQPSSSEDAVQTVVHDVSHDLRAPLRHIMGFVEILREEARPTLSGKSLGRLTTISEAARRMGNLIDDLLAFSRVGRAELQKAEVNLDQ